MIYLCAVIASLIANYLALRIPIMDVPTHDRHSHKIPIPRTGGLAIFGVLGFFGLLTWAGIPTPVYPDAHIVLFFMFAGFGIGLCDDVFTLSAISKGLALLLLGFCAAMYIPLPPIYFPGFGETHLNFMVMIVFSTLWVFSFTNIANFMDGANGLAMGCMAIMYGALGLLAVGAWSANNGPTLWLISLIIIGFLPWNFANRVFGGDSASLGLGCGIAVSILLLAQYWTIWSLITLTLPFLIDGLLTLADRARRRAPVLQAHNEHVYQRLIQAGWSHLRCSILYYALTVFCALCGILAALQSAPIGTLIFCLTSFFLSVLWFCAHFLLRIAAKNTSS